MTSRRVLIVNPGADVYGSDLQMLESVGAMVQAGWEVHLLLPELGPLVERAHARGATTEIMPFPIVRRSHLSVRGILGLAWRTLRESRPMVRAIRRAQVDAVYVNTTTIPGWIAAARISRVPVLCHVHEAEDRDGALILKALHTPLLLANRLILISDTAQEAMCRALPRLRRRSVLVRNGVPDRASPPVAEPSESGGHRLTAVARLSPRKGTDIAVGATAALVAAGRDVTLELAGSHFPGYEWYVEQLRSQVASAGIEDRVLFAGHVSPPYAAFDRANVVLAPSLREPFGNSVVEAQLSERAVVAAAAGGHLESIDDGKTGVLVPVGDADAMAAAVAALLDDPVRRRAIAEAARSGAIEHFGVERYQRRIVEVIEAEFRQTARASSAAT